MNWDNLKTRLLNKATPFLAQGFEVDFLSDTKIELVKTFPPPRTERRYTFTITNWGYPTISNQMARWPGQCERCGKKEIAYSVRAEDKPDSDWITCCMACFKPGEQTALVEWNWSDVDGVPGVAGEGPKVEQSSFSGMWIPKEYDRYNTDVSVVSGAAGYSQFKFDKLYNPPQGGSQMLHTIKEIKEKNDKTIHKAEQTNRLIEAIEVLSDLKVDVPSRLCCGKPVEYGAFGINKQMVPLGDHFTFDQFEELLAEINEAMSKVLVKKVSAMKDKLDSISK